MKNILIPTDFSENSWNAVKYALLLFKEVQCNFYLLHATRPHVYATGNAPIVLSQGNLEEVFQNRSRGELEKLLLRIEAESLSSRHNFTLLPEYDFFIDVMRKQVKEKKMDLIVMGTKGASGLKEVTVGSNTGDVITKVKCPVLVIPEDATFRVPREIVFPTDYRMSYPLRILDTMTGMANMFGAAIRILHIVKDENEEMDETQKKNKVFLQDYMREKEHSFHRLTNKNLEEAIQCFTESRDIDWIAMMAKKLHFFQQLLFRPTVAKISYHTRIPFLVLHE